jgi:hypothetical protein
VAEARRRLRAVLAEDVAHAGATQALARIDAAVRADRARARTPDAQPEASPSSDPIPDL